MQSPFQEHLKTNYVPTDAEIERIRAHLAPHEAELARLESLILELTIQRDRVRDYIEPHKALLSQPRRLPQDIVEEIFLDCLPTDHYAVMSAAEAPLLLGRICSAWRSIAYGMPRLWSTLHIPFVFVAHRAGKVAMSDWLERSAPLPVALTMLCGWQPEIDILDSLARFSPRWSALHVSTSRPGDLLHLAEVHAPLLAEIYLDLGDVLADNPEFNADMAAGFLSSNLFRTMTSTRIIISGEALGALVPTSPFAWNHLSHLTLKTSYYTDRLDLATTSQIAYRLLQGCQNLSSLRFTLTTIWPLPPWTNESLVLPSLESLVIDGGSYPEVSDDLANLLGHLSMPHLHQFKIPCSHPSLSESSHGFFDHLARHSPAISDLACGRSCFTKNSLLETLHLFPTLTRLGLNIWSWNTAPGDPDSRELILATLSPSSDSPNPFPALRELDIECSGWLDDDIWRNFVETQVVYETNLQRFHLIIVETDRSIVPTDVKFSLAGGLEVAVKYNHFGPKPTPWEGMQR